MQTIKKSIDITKTSYIEIHYPLESTLLFDIETTGFSPDYTSLYLIGYMYYNLATKSWYITQLFNDDGNSEQEMLETFAKELANYSYLISFNGDGFDIPYLLKKADKYNLSIDFCSILSIDMYKLVRPLKKFLYLDNLKLKTIEIYLDIYREDKYSGGDLINIYKGYLINKDPISYKLLLQHNFEDIGDMLALSDILAYKDLLDGKFHVQKYSVENEYLLLDIELLSSIPKRLAKSMDHIIINGIDNHLVIKVPILEDILKFYFKDYKNYYFLPAEGKAIHKSVATYVDKEYRIKATPKTCYVNHKGAFILQYDKKYQGYKYNYEDIYSYIEITEDFLNNKDLLRLYVKNLLNESVTKKLV